MAIYPKLILDALSHVRYPGTGKDIVSSGMVEDDIRISGNKVSFSIIFDKPNDPFAKSIIKAAESAILTYVGEDVDIRGNISAKTPHVQQPSRPLPGVKNIIAVSSGKGGVGKSTVAANLAMSLALKGYTVGLLDADIFGPSIPKMFGIEDARPMGEEIDGRQMILPIERYPGTSDIHLTLVQELDFTGAIVVSTPQQVALADARKGLQMFQNDKINVPILGLVENMAWFTPAEHPDERYYIFGREGCKQLAEERGVPLLAQIPLVQSICESGDAGAPIVVNQNSLTARAFDSLADAVIDRIEELKH